MADTGDAIMFLGVGSMLDFSGGESVNTLTPGDKLTADFEDDTFFDVQSYGFSMALFDDESANAPPSGPRAKPSFARWRATSPGSKPSPVYRPQPALFTFVRGVEEGSPRLLELCLTKKVLAGAVLVQRGRVGEAPPMGRIRLEFKKVAIKGVEWSDGDVVLETCCFEFQSVKVTYVKLKDDGTALSNIGAEWQR